MITEEQLWDRMIQEVSKRHCRGTLGVWRVDEGAVCAQGALMRVLRQEGHIIFKPADPVRYRVDTEGTKLAARVDARWSQVCGLHPSIVSQNDTRPLSELIAWMEKCRAAAGETP